MEPLAHIALCPAANSVLQLHLQAWPQPFAAIAQQWWSSSPHRGDKRIFVRTMVPSTRLSVFLIPTPGQSASVCRKQFRESLALRGAALKTAFSTSMDWLRDNASFLPRPPPLTPKTWATTGCPFSTSHTHTPPCGTTCRPLIPFHRKSIAHPQRNGPAPTTPLPLAKATATPPRTEDPPPSAPSPPQAAPPSKQAKPSSSTQTTLIIAPPPPC